MEAGKNPNHEPVNSCTGEASEVLTLRDKFAIAALQGVLGSFRNNNWPKGGFPIIAQGAYLVADAMLEARAAARKA